MKSNSPPANSNSKPAPGASGRSPNEEASVQARRTARQSNALSGATVFKVKPGTMKKLLACADRHGVKRVGYGKIIFAGDSALVAMSIVRATVRTLLERDLPLEPRKIIALMRLQRDFNRQLLDSGKALIAE
jgi:hypothetical protein